MLAHMNHGVIHGFYWLNLVGHQLDMIFLCLCSFLYCKILLIIEKIEMLRFLFFKNYYLKLNYDEMLWYHRFSWSRMSSFMSLHYFTPYSFMYYGFLPRIHMNSRFHYDLKHNIKQSYLNRNMCNANFSIDTL